MPDLTLTVKYYELSAKLRIYFFKQYEVIKTKSLLKELIENRYICTVWKEPTDRYSEAEFRKVSTIHEYRTESRRLKKYRKYLETIDFEELDVCLSPYTARQKT